ncbi:sigma-70 family RNA polymerase sigma factor [Gemmata sp. G18]|uniref:Sigma-70 family RNA polymerase sigma factor n=1 Tax=Gemmata palustris TaxID=2822762 RepID=A0ABS5BPM9_9BACT|nr:sigma-70 family RNA polymerase sigma factor [Gemmata palustris]MBP3955668.1 sigma-70 family RNA polymerase sigma factor [Gemmata palustris]
MMNTFGPRETLRPPARNETARGTGREFVRLFGPVVYALARKRGFGDAAAADLMHEVLTRAARGEGPGAGASGRDAIHARLVTATQSAMAAVRSANEDRPRRTDATGSIATFELGRTPDLDTDWESELQRQLARTAMGRVKREFSPLDWQAFWGTAVEGRTGAAVGPELGMTAGTVHVVKCQVLARLREEVDRLQLDAESWGTPARRADRPEGAVVQDLGPEDIERTSLHVPYFWRQG